VVLSQRSLISYSILVVLTDGAAQLAIYLFTAYSSGSQLFHVSHFKIEIQKEQKYIDLGDSQ